MKRRKLWLAIALCIVLMSAMSAFVACNNPTPADPVTVTGVEKTATEGAEDVYTVTLSNGTTHNFNVPSSDSVTVASVVLASTEGYVDTYLVTMTNGATYTFTVSNVEQCAVTLTVTDENGTPVEGATVTNGEFTALTNADGKAQLVTSGAGATVSIEKVGFEAYELVLSEDEVKTAGATLALDVELTSIRTQEGYRVRNENYMDIYVPCGESAADGAWVYWYVEYGDTLNVSVDYVDDTLAIHPTDIGYCDNIEFVVQTVSTDTGWVANQSLDVLIGLPREGHWVRRADTASGFATHDYSAQYMQNGLFSYTKTARTKSVDGYDGMTVEIKLSYELWNLTKASAVGNMSIVPAARNGNFAGATEFRYFDKLDCIWGKADYAVRIEADGKPVESYFDIPDFDERLSVTAAKVAGKTIANDMATVESTSGGLTRQVLEGVQLFTDRNYLLPDIAIPASLHGKSYLRSAISVAQSFKVTKAGYVVIAFPAEGDYYNKGVTFAQNNGFAKIANALPAYDMNAAGTTGMSERMDYYAKWCEVGQNYTVERWGVVFFAEQASYAANTWDSVGAKVIKLDTPALRAEWAPSNRRWQGIPGIETITKPDGSIRLWGTWFTGNNSEPNIGNYAVYYFSDDLGENWTPAFVVSFTEHNQDIPNSYTVDTRVFDPCIFVYTDKDTGKNNIILGWNQTGYAQGPGSVWEAVIENADGDLADMNALAPRMPALGLRINKPIVLSTGEWLFATRYGTEIDRVYVYSSTDEGETWVEKGYTEIYSCYFVCESTISEVIDSEGKSTLIMWSRNSQQYGISVAYSYDYGATWTKNVEIDHRSPSSRPSSYSLGGNNVLYVHHYINNREQLVAYLSTDGGKTFPHALILDMSEGTSYPDVDVDKNGTIWITWDHNRYGEKHIHFTSITMDELLAIDGVATLDRNRIKVMSSLTLDGMVATEITGKVVDGTEAIVGATVKLSNVFGSQYVTTTDANGVFRLANVPADLYTVTVQKEGYYDLVVVPFTKADYLDAEFNVVALGEFELSAAKTQTITGTVKNVATRSAAAGVTVDVNGVTATTDATGAFTAQNVGASADGTVTVTLSGADYRTQTKVVNFADSIGEFMIEDKNTVVFGTVGGTDNVPRYELYAVREQAGLHFYGYTDVALGSGTDRLAILMQAYEVGDIRGAHTVQLEYYSQTGLIRLFNYPANNAVSAQLAQGTGGSLTYNGVTITNDKTSDHFSFVFPYAILTEFLKVDFAAKNYVVDASTELYLSILPGRKIDNVWKLSEWQYADSTVDGYGVITRYLPKQYCRITPDNILLRSTQYDKFTSVEAMDAFFATTEVAQTGMALSQNLGTLNLTASNSITWSKGHYFFSDRTIHCNYGSYPAFDGMTALYDGVKESTTVTVTKTGYFLMIAISSNVADVASPWVRIDSNIPNPGYVNTSDKAYCLYAAYAQAGTSLFVPTDAVILSAGAQAQTAQTAKILVFGDSYTDTRFWTSFANAMGTKGAKTIGISGSRINTPTNGDSLGWTERVRQGEIAAYAPEKILIHIGVNDLDNGVMALDAAYQLVELLTLLREQLPETEIYYTLIMPNYTFQDLVFERYAEYNKLVKQFIDTQNDDKLSYIDVWDSLFVEGNPNYAPINGNLFSDRLHLNAAGYEIWYNAICEAMGI